MARVRWKNSGEKKRERSVVLAFCVAEKNFFVLKIYFEGLRKNLLKLEIKFFLKLKFEKFIF